MYRRIFILLFCLFSFDTSLKAQPESKQNFTYFEVGGAGVLFSFNYERQLKKEPGPGFRIGAGIVPLVGISFPASVNYLFKTKKENSFIEAAFGVTYLITDEEKFGKIESLNFVPSLGYRFQNRRKGFFRISLSPICNNEGVFPLVGFAFGKRF